ncbi:MAG TPA: DNA polymerase I [Bacilli bacterium]
MEKLLLIDGNSIANRAFYALPLLSNTAGLHTNAVYGFTTMLLKLIEDEQPTHLLVAFDAGKITFRHQDYAAYKGGRAKTPPELSEQFPLLRELLSAMGIAQFELAGYEADDIIGTLAARGEAAEMNVLVVSGDKDLLQLASDRVKIALTRKGISEVELYDTSAIREKYGLTPRQIIDLKGLMGDNSDNIPGLPGVGEKTALKLLRQYGSVEEVLEHAADIKGKLGETVREHQEDARLSKRLATIFREVPLDMPWDHVRFTGLSTRSTEEMFRKLGFRTLLDKLGAKVAQTADESETANEGRFAPADADLPVVVADGETLAQLSGKLAAVSTVHVEVAGENPHDAQLIGMAFYTSEKVYYLPGDSLKLPEASAIRDWFGDGSREKSLFDSHKAEIALAWHGVKLSGVAFDALLAAYLLDPTESGLTLAGIAAKYGLPRLAEDDEVFGKGAKFAIPELSVLSKHLSRKAATIAKLRGILSQELVSHGMESLYYELEQPLVSVLSMMEMTGVKVDAEDLKQYGNELADGIKRLERQIHELAGVEFNINSPKQLGEILFDKLGLPVVKKTKTGYSTDAEVLEKLAPYHDIVALILHYRQLAKLQSTYVEGLLKEIRPQTGKVHTYFRQTIAATGRLSSQFPNLQNIPIRLEEGKKIRKVFKPSEPGWHILSADYSQIELRVLAHISQDEKLIEAFQNDMDIHTKTAMDVFGVSADQVDANMRRQAKAVNFGIVYGISDYGLAQNLNITRKEAAQFIEQYFEVFKGVRAYMENIVRQAKRDGYVTTLLARRRYLPDIHAANYNIRSFAERTAMNTPIQGTAADIIKLAMVKIAERMRKEAVKSRMLLQVHDELVFEVPEAELPLMRTLVPDLMGRALKLDVPLKVDVETGANWYEA